MSSPSKADGGSAFVPIVDEHRDRNGDRNFVAPPSTAAPSTRSTAGAKESLYAFGWNGAGQLGTGDTDNKKTACAVEPLADKNVAIVACGGPYTVLATDTEEVWGFGANARCVPLFHHRLLRFVPCRHRRPPPSIPRA